MAGERPMFYIVDGHAVAYRNYFGLPVAGFSTKEGEPTNATYGFTRVLLDILLKYRPKYLAVSFDMGLSGRDELFEEYKGTREKMPDDLRLQMERIQQMVEAFNIPVLAIEGYEADDIIGTVAKQAEEQGIHVRVITGDRDLLQLLTDNVTVELPSHGRGQPDIVYDIPAFIEKYTVRPDQFVDWKALVGDSSDNIPGVAGIGQKTATSLLLEFETLNGIYESIELLKGSTKRKLIDGRELAYLSQELATIQRDAPITLDLEACVAHDYDSEIVLELFRTLEFRGFADRLMESLTPTTQSMFESDDFGAGSDEDFAPPPKVEGLVETIVVYDQTGLDALVETLNNAAAITWDVETTSVDQMQAELVGIALATNGDIGYYVPVGHQSGKQLPLKTVIDALRPPLTNPNVPKYAHNAAYDMVVMQRYGIEVAPVTFDTMIAEWLRDPISKHLGLKNLALHELSVYMTPIKELIGTGKKQKTMDMVAVQDAAPYAAADAAITHRLVERLNDDLVKQGLDTLYQTLEIPLVPVISAMEQVGVVLDVAFLRDMSKLLDKQIEDLTQEIYGLIGGYGEFNIKRPKQLNDVLF
jgi:DNA polymerase-1